MLLTKAGGFFKPTAGGSLGLQTNLTGFWSLENTSWTDDTGNGTTLTPTASPTTAAGIVGNGVSVNGTTQALTAASNTNILNGGSSFSSQCWVNITGAAPPEWTIFCKDNDAFGQREWGFGVRFTTSNVWSVVLSNTSTTLFRADSLVTTSSGWHHLVLTFNSSTGAALIYVDGSVSGSGVTVTGTMNSSASAPLGVGARGSLSSFMTAGTIDQCGFWKGRVLSAGDVTLLYNSGAGLTYAAMA